MKSIACLFLLLLLAACSSSMSSREFLQASQNCERQNEQLDAQVSCLNEFLITRNAESSDVDVYYTWVKERDAIMELHQSGELNAAKTRLALLDAQNKYQQILRNRDLVDIAQFQAMELRRPLTCRSAVIGNQQVQTICD